MEKEFTHLLLTRFNTAIDFASSRLGLQTEWLHSRLSLFEQYCLPSVAAQQNADFQWIVFFDADSPEWLRLRIESFSSFLTPIYISGPATDETIAASIGATGSVRTPYLLTTRLDNDDSLAKTHMAHVEHAFARQEREFLVFPFGLQLYRGHLYSIYWPSNPFLSLVEKVQSGDRFTTVFCAPHHRIRDAGPVRQVLCSPQWMQVLHSANVLNSLRGWPRLMSLSHPNFAVRWPQARAEDSLADRIKLSAGAYHARANKFVRKVAARLGEQMS